MVEVLTVAHCNDTTHHTTPTEVGGMSMCVVQGSAPTSHARNASHTISHAVCADWLSETHTTHASPKRAALLMFHDVVPPT